MTDLAAWLSAQLDHDEQVARAATPAPWRLAIVYGTVFSDAAGVTLAQARELSDAEHVALHDPAHVLRTVAAHRAILAEHLPTLTGVEWPHDTTGKGEALACPRCQNAEHTTNWNPPIGMAGVLPEGFVAPYVLAPCRTLLLLAAIYTDREGWDPSWRAE